MEPSNTLDVVWPNAALMVRQPPAPSARAPVRRRSAAAATPRPATDVANEPSSCDPASLCDLLARIAKRDERALTAFYDATVPRVYGLALRIVRSAAEAEEITVDTFHQVWRDATRFDPSRGTPFAWLLTICRSRALDVLRARDRAQAHDDPHSLLSPEDAGTDDDPQDLVDAMQSHSALRAVLARLPAAQRQMLGLAFFRRLPHDEISAQTALPLGTVKSQIRRALAALRDDLASS